MSMDLGGMMGGGKKKDAGSGPDYGTAILKGFAGGFAGGAAGALGGAAAGVGAGAAEGVAAGVGSGALSGTSAGILEGAGIGAATGAGTVLAPAAEGVATGAATGAGTVLAPAATVGGAGAAPVFSPPIMESINAVDQVYGGGNGVGLQAKMMGGSAGPNGGIPQNFGQAPPSSPGWFSKDGVLFNKEDGLFKDSVVGRLVNRGDGDPGFFQKDGPFHQGLQDLMQQRRQQQRSVSPVPGPNYQVPTFVPGQPTRYFQGPQQSLRRKMRY